MGVVVEEADETVYWLELIQASGACSSSELPSLLIEAGELCAIFTQSHITARANASSRLTALSQSAKRDQSRSKDQSRNRLVNS
jgi:hypothetical protein